MSLTLSSELERFHTVREVAELLGYEKSSIYNLLNEGRLRCVKIGRSNRIPRSAVDELIAKNVKPRCSYPSRIAPAAKEAVRSAGLADNQSALLKVASAPAETQVEAVERIVQSRAQPAAKASHDLSTPPSLAPMRDVARPLRGLINISGGELARWIKITTPNDRPHVVRVLRMAADILKAEHEGQFETDPEVAAQ